MSSGLAAAAVAVRALAPILNDMYVSAKKTTKERLEGWRAGADLQKVALYYERLSSVKTIWSRDEAVSIESFYYPSRIISRTQSRTASGLKDLPEGCVVIEGVVGQGKSIFMRYLALSVLSDPTLKKIPLFIELRNLSEKTTLITLLHNVLAEIGVNADATVFKYLANDDRLVIFLDGFDEIAGEAVSETIGLIHALKISYPNLKIIVSSRPQNAIQNVANFKVVQLDFLNSKDHDKFLKKLGVSPARRVELIEAMENSPEDIQEAISTPLMMSIVVLVYESVHLIPPYLSDFFSALFHVVFTQHDSIKEAFRREHHTGLSEGRLQHLFEAFCYVVMQKDYGRTLSSRQFDECFEKALKYVTGCQCSADNFKADIVGVACLMLEEGVGDVTFLHKGILDYFAAAFGARLNDSLAEKSYNAAAKSYREWRVTLQFLSKIDTQRYLKYYFLVHVAGQVELLTRILKSEDKEGLTTFVRNLYVDMRFRKKKATASIEYVTQDGSEFLEDAARVCTYALNGLEYNRVSIEELGDMAREYPGLHVDMVGDAVMFGIDAAMVMFAYEPVRKSLAAVEREWSGRIQEAKNILAELELSENIIDSSFEV